MLLVDAACAVHWSDASMPHLLVVRPQLKDCEEVSWSGGFELKEQEDYFGLRVHYVQNGIARYASCPFYHPQCILCIHMFDSQAVLGVANVHVDAIVF